MKPAARNRLHPTPPDRLLEPIHASKTTLAADDRADLVGTAPSLDRKAVVQKVDEPGPKGRGGWKNDLAVKVSVGLLLAGIAGISLSWNQLWVPAHGKALEITLEAIVDEIAAAANLLIGEAGDGTPAVVFRGLKYPRSGGGSVFMAEDKDVIRPRLSR